MGLGVAVIPILAAWASVRLLRGRALRARKSAAAAHLAAVAICWVANVFIGGFFSRSASDIALVFVLTLEVQAVGFFLTVIALVKSLLAN